MNLKEAELLISQDDADLRRKITQADKQLKLKRLESAIESAGGTSKYLQNESKRLKREIEELQSGIKELTGATVQIEVAQTFMEFESGETSQMIVFKLYI